MRQKYGTIWKIPEIEFRDAILKSETNTETLQKFGLKNHGGISKSFRERLKELGIDTSHFHPEKAKLNPSNTLSKIDAIKKYFVEKGMKGRCMIRKYLLKYHLIEVKCVSCGMGAEWNGKPITLQIEHKNGNGRDHRLENLEWLCPNCHSQTETFAGRNCRKLDEQKASKKTYHCKCGNKVSYWSSRTCAKCAGIKKEKIQWPDTEILKRLVWEKSVIALSKELGISDKAIEKRCKKLGIEKPPRGYWQKKYANKI